MQKSPSFNVGLAVICACFFMTSLDITIVNVALPAITTNLHAPLSQVVWIINGYLLIYAALVVPAGRLGDIVGQRSVFLVGLLLFTLASLLCALSQNISMLIGARILQGIGSACLSAPSLALLTSIVPTEKRGAALGIYSSMVALASVIAPVVSGLLVANLSWHWIFLVNLPIGVVLVIGTLLSLPQAKIETPKNLDVVGVLLAILGLFALSFVIVEGPSYHWGTVAGPVTIWNCLIVGILLLVGLVLWERAQAEPFLPLPLFKNWSFSKMITVYTVLSFAAFGNSLLVVLYLESALKVNAFLTGLMLLPQALAAIAVAPLAGKLSDRIGGKYVLIIGILCYALGLGLFALVSTTQISGLLLIVAFVISGMGLICTMVSLMGEVLRDVPAPMMGTASGTLNLSRLVGGSIGVAVIAGFLQSHLTDAASSQRAAVMHQVPIEQQQEFTAYLGQLTQNTTPQTSLSVNLQQVAVRIYQESFVSALHATLLLLVVLLVASLLLVLTIRTAASKKPEEVDVVPSVEATEASV